MGGGGRRARAQSGLCSAMRGCGPVGGAAGQPALGDDVQLIARQVRIEQRVVVRIAPASTTVRQNMLAELPQRAVSPRFEEAGNEKCVALEGIAGVQTGSGNRLVLFLRDRRMISVNLEKSCRARDFYSGFYVERRKDGRLCVDRDELQSRTGARCEVDSMRRLVEVRE